METRKPVDLKFPPCCFFWLNVRQNSEAFGDWRIIIDFLRVPVSLSGFCSVQCSRCLFRRLGPKNLCVPFRWKPSTRSTCLCVEAKIYLELSGLLAKMAKVKEGKKVTLLRGVISHV